MDINSIKENVVLWGIYAIFGLIGVVLVSIYGTYHSIGDDIHKTQTELDNHNEILRYENAFVADVSSFSIGHGARLDQLENRNYEVNVSMVCKEAFCNKKINVFDAFRYAEELNRERERLSRYDIEKLDISLPLYLIIERLLKKESKIWDEVIGYGGENKNCSINDYVQRKNRLMKDLYLISGTMLGVMDKLKKKGELLVSEGKHMIQEIEGKSSLFNFLIFSLVFLIILAGAILWLLFLKKHPDGK